jgi:hypothetical protein
MSARTKAPTRKRAGPHGEGAGRVETPGGGGRTTPILTHDRGTAQPRCWLCPLPRCGYEGCRVDVEAVST